MTYKYVFVVMMWVQFYAINLSCLYMTNVYLALLLDGIMHPCRGNMCGFL